MQNTSVAQNTGSIQDQNLIAVQDQQEPRMQRQDAIAASESIRIGFENAKIKGSILLKGAIIDDLILKQYKESMLPDSNNIALLSPKGVENSAFVEFGWFLEGQVNSIYLPNKDTMWSIDRENSTSDKMILFWQNPHGIRFELSIALDDKYMLTVMQRIVNYTDSQMIVSGYGLVNRNMDGILINSGPRTNEGVLAVPGQKVLHYDYKKLAKRGTVRLAKGDGDGKKWIAFSDKYWLTALVVPDSIAIMDLQAAIADSGYNKSQVSFVSKSHDVAPNSELVLQSNLFLGAKELSVLDGYAKKYNIAFFDRALDFGLFYFITKPLLILLQYLHHIVRNFGVAILLLTIIVKGLMFPLAIKTYVSGRKMKALQPKIKLIQEKYANDKMKLNSEMVNLFKQHKANPLSGCLPFIIQIPIFFALYKVLIVSIEMRHAPFFGWIKDLSAQDPINFLIFLKYLNFEILQGVLLGPLPIVLTATMVLQQKITGVSSGDPSQERAIKMMPYFFLFIFASFPAGLLIYWIWSNIISILQHLLVVKLKHEN